MSEVADTIGVVGAGSFGIALSRVLTRAGRGAVLLSKDGEVVDEINRDHRAESRLPGVDLPESLVATRDPDELAARARFVVLAVSSTELRARLVELGDAIDGRHLVVHALGALAEPGDVRVSEAIRQETPALRIGALAGPALPRDLVLGRAASMVCASQFDEVSATARRLLNAPPGLRVYRGHDLAGVELASALAGAYTIALGLADKLEVGVGTRAVLVTRALSEIARIVVASGGEERTVSGLAGLGNLLVRSDRERASESPSYAYGRRLGAGDGAGARVVEGARAAIASARLANRLGLRVPLLQGLVSVIEGQASASDAARAIIAHVAEEE